MSFQIPLNDELTELPKAPFVGFVSAPTSPYRKTPELFNPFVSFGSWSDRHIRKGATNHV